MENEKNNIKRLKDLAKNSRVHSRKVPDGKSLNDYYLENESLEELIRSGELTPVEMAENIPIPTPMSTLVTWEEVKDKTIESDFIIEDHPDTESNSDTGYFFKDDALEDDHEEESENITPKLITVHDSKRYLKLDRNTYYILGSIPDDFSFMGITLMIECNYTKRKERTRIDLYDRDAVINFTESYCEVSNQSISEIEAEFVQLTDVLEEFREERHLLKEERKTKKLPKVDSKQNDKVLALLKDPKLIEKLNDLIGKTGVVGEENTRLLIFLIASTYKMGYPLHALVQGSSGSGKSHLINSIGKALPPEDVMSMTRVTSKSFYHYQGDDLVNKLMLIQDFDGLDEEAQYAFRELQSAGTISSSTTYKDRSGSIVSRIKTVRSHFASLLATTQADVYYDNLSRCLIIGVDESEEQTLRIIDHQNNRLAGLVDKKEESESVGILQALTRNLKPYEVINKYANKVRPPLEAKMLRRLNSHYQSFVKQITLLFQHQREKDELGRLIATKEDLVMATDILFDAIILKVDELDSSLRQFFDRMKEFVGDKDKEFSQRDLRLGLNVSKSYCFRYMDDLEQLEYIQKSGGYSNKGFTYKIVYFDDMEKIKSKIKESLKKQLDAL
jgi:energy-coupling factor transporter ATP-binding protein EcfA2